MAIKFAVFQAIAHEESRAHGGCMGSDEVRTSHETVQVSRGFLSADEAGKELVRLSALVEVVLPGEKFERDSRTYNRQQKIRKGLMEIRGHYPYDFSAREFGQLFIGIVSTDEKPRAYRKVSRRMRRRVPEIGAG